MVYMLYNIISDLFTKHKNNNLSYQDKTLLLEQLIVEHHPDDAILSVFSSDDFSSHQDLYKWVCAFCSTAVLEHIDKSGKVLKHMESAINASIINHNTPTFSYLLKHYPKQTLNSYHLQTSIKRAQGYKRKDIFLLYLQNIEKIENIDMLKFINDSDQLLTNTQKTALMAQFEKDKLKKQTNQSIDNDCKKAIKI